MGYGATIAGIWVLTAMIITTIIIFQFFFGTTPYNLWQSYCCLSLFVICVSYASIVVKFLCGAHPQHHGAASRQRKLTVTLFITAVASLLLWLPHAVGSFLALTTNVFKSVSYRKVFRLRFSCMALYQTNSLVNPIVYTVRIPEFRKALFLLFKHRQR